MDLLKELKNLKEISPDPAFILRSKQEILYRPKFTLGNILVFNSPRMAFATLGILALFVFGAFRFYSPTEIAKVDPKALRAEAQAIGIQIEVANVNYAEVEASDKETTPSKSISTTIKKTPEPVLDESIEKALEELAE